MVPPLVLRLSRRSFPFITKAFADMGFAGDGPANAASITIEIVRKPPDQVGFAVPPQVGRGKVLRLDQPQRPPPEGPGSDPRLGQSLPLCRLRHAPHPPLGPSLITFGTDSKWFIRDVMWYDGSFSPAGDLPCVARLFACAN